MAGIQTQGGKSRRAQRGQRNKKQRRTPDSPAGGRGGGTEGQDGVSRRWDPTRGGGGQRMRRTPGMGRVGRGGPERKRETHSPSRGSRRRGVRAEGQPHLGFSPTGLGLGPACGSHGLSHRPYGVGRRCLFLSTPCASHNLPSPAPRTVT